MGVPDLDQHLRFPVIPASPLRGSDIGRALWDSEQGRAVVDYLLTDPRIAQHHPPVPEFNLVEIRGRVASFALAALSAPEPQNFVRANVGTLFDELLNNPQGTSYWFIRGADIAGDGFPIDPWTTLISATDEAWNTLAARLPDGGLVVVPSDANVVVIVRTHVEREEIPFAASWVHLWPEIIVRRACLAIWLATGVHPKRAVRGVVPDATFPHIRPTLEWESPEQRGGALSPDAPATLVADQIQAMFHLVNREPWIDPENGFDDATARALRSAMLLLEPAVAFADGALVALAAYATMDGLLRNHEENDSVVVPRLAHLLGLSVGSRRTLRTKITALYEIRSAVAHGERPSWNQVSAFLGDNSINDEMDWLTENDARDRFKWAAYSLARCAWGAMLYVTGTPGPFEPPRMTRSRAEVIDLLNRAAHNDDEAQGTLDAGIPDWLRDPIFVVER